MTLTPGASPPRSARAARAAALVDRTGAGEDPVTQFEALTAAAYSELAEQAVEVAVIEAGLGGRYDATNVIPSRVQVLTSVGLEHTRWLGPTLTDIATEKLDVVQPGATLVLGAGLAPEARAVADRVASERSATIVQAGTDPGVPVGAPGRLPAAQLRPGHGRRARPSSVGSIPPRWPRPRPACACRVACSRSTPIR